MNRSIACLLSCALLTIGVVTTAGCSPAVWAVSSAPPARVGELWKKDNQGEDRIRVSKGVAFAIECEDIWLGGACRDATARMKNPEVARVLPAHLEKMQSSQSRQTSYVDQDVSHRSVFVIAGVAPGETMLTIESADGNRQFAVDVTP